MYSLSSNVVDCLAFCTKKPEPKLKYLDELDVYKQYWFVTISQIIRLIPECAWNSIIKKNVYNKWKYSDKS